VYDVLIVGGGPAGLNAALVLARCRRRIAVFDNGLPRNAVARALHGFLGHDGINPRELLALGRHEIERYGAEFIEDTVVAAEQLSVEEARPCATGFRIRTASGDTVEGRKLLFATGMCDDLPDLPGLRECYGECVHHCPYCDGWEHRDQHLLALGKSAEAAAGLGILLRTWTDRITVLLNGEELDGGYRDRLTRHGIAICGERIVEVVHQERRLQGVRLVNGDKMQADALFFNTGCHARCLLPRDLGCEFESPDVAHTGRRQKTNIPGLFLAGDADGDVQFVVVAAAEGATAAVAINRELSDEDRC
jgi:thioredoxin reductase